MKELNAYVYNLNLWIKRNKCSIKTPYTLATKLGREEVASDLNMDMEPENIYRDGEASKEEADQRFYMLNKIAHQLVKLDPTLTIHEME
jgi:hypothetical protein